MDVNTRPNARLEARRSGEFRPFRQGIVEMLDRDRVPKDVVDTIPEASLGGRSPVPRRRVKERAGHPFTFDLKADVTLPFLPLHQGSDRLFVVLFDIHVSIPRLRISRIKCGVR